LPVPPLCEWSPAPRLHEWILPLIFVIGVLSSITSSILKTFSSFWNLLLDALVR
ncbi:Hypothetical protein FKW44_007002, partial [Caligus rogercresseyi]